MEEVKKKQAVSLSEVKELLKNQDPENMDQIQRWTFDYVSKVSNLDVESAKKMKQQLVKDCNINWCSSYLLSKLYTKTFMDSLCGSRFYFNRCNPTCNRRSC